VSIENLTRDEARARAGLIRADSYDVTLDLTSAPNSDETFRSTSVIRFGCTEPGASTHLDITAIRVGSATLNGRDLDIAAVFDGRRLQLDGLAADNELVVEADCVYSRTGEGLHRFTDPVDKETYLYTQFESFDAHRMFACFDQPDIKATFAFSVRTPEHWTVISNMPGTSEPAGERIARWTFPATPRQSTYITALVAGPYHSVYDEHDGIPLGLFCRQSLAEHLDPDELFEITKAGFDHFHREFDYRYPWPKYDQLFVPEFNAGAMENAGCVTFLEDFVFRSRVTDAARQRRAIVILHEMAHMWFGDLVTMRWWDDLWLNESFAEYASQHAAAVVTRWLDSWTTFCNIEKNWAYRQDQLPTTHPIAADIVDIEAVRVNFDGITYAKGASVLKQLVYYVGEDAFRTALRGYFGKHEYGNTTLQDLLDELAAASGRDLSTWSKEWLQTAGVNTLRPSFEVDGDGAFTSFAVTQEAPDDHPTLRSHRLRIGLYDLTGGRLERRDQVELDVVGARTEIDQLVGTKQPDLVLVNDDDLAYAKIRLDERSLRTLVDHVSALSDSMPRALCWQAAWDMTRDGEMRAGDYLDLVIGGIETEEQIGTVQTVLGLARQAIDPYGDPARRAERAARLADRLVELLQAAEPGSDRQLAFARALAANAATDGQLDIVAGLLSGDRVIEGLSVDTELRWTLLGRLVTKGRGGDREIDAELARDDTAAGRRHAVELHAAHPSAEAKAEAWRITAESVELPNHELEAAVAGFMRPEHRELLSPYVEKYFDSVRELWDTRSSEMAQLLVSGLYPTYAVDQQAVLDRTDAFLHDADPPPALRRLVTESRDMLARFVRTQAVDSAPPPR
jgi:aminopeptidase N